MCVVHCDNGFHAVSDTCSHEDYLLAEGEVDAMCGRDRVLEARQSVLAFDRRAADPSGDVPVNVVQVVVGGRRRVGGAAVTALPPTGGARR